MLGAWLNEPIQVGLAVTDFSAHLHKGDWVSAGASPDVECRGFHAEVVGGLLRRHHLWNGARFSRADALIGFPAACYDEQVRGSL